MNTRKLAAQALSYLDALTLENIPDCNRWLKQNENNYKALLKLNKRGLGATSDELIELANAPLSDKYAKSAVTKMMKIDSEINATYKAEDNLDRNPSMWIGFFSGYETTPTAMCKRKLLALKNKRNKLVAELDRIAKSITKDQAIKFGYPTDGYDDNDFCQA